MLTGGIDLSVGTVASMAAFVMATQTGAQGPVVAIVLALVAATLAGIVNGIGVGVFKVHPLIMTLGIAPGDPRADERLPARDGPGRDGDPGVHRLARLGDDALLPAEQPVPVHPAGRC